MSNAEAQQEIYGQLVTLVDNLILLPAVAVSEVGQMDRIELNAGSPSWLIGFRELRGQRQPVVCMEALCGGQIPPRSSRAKLVGVRSVSDGPGWAFISQGQPHLATLTPNAMKAETLKTSDNKDLVVARTRIANLSAMIPDLAAMENEITEAAAKASTSQAAAEPWEFGAEAE
ncbi:MAG: chemotaxis protein CheW [Salinisphaeraceae bacterium]|nr:chemotaxis protein CheW [Salinisphaeraceae bacterium]